MELTVLGYTLAATGYTFAMTALGAASRLRACLPACP